MSEPFDGADLAERVVSMSRSSNCQVIVEAQSSANLRWARNSLTTNGFADDVTVTVIGFDDRADGVAVASMTSPAGDGQLLRSLVDAVDEAARRADVADDVAPFPRARTDSAYAHGAEGVDESELRGPSETIGALSEWAGSSGVDTYGFAELDVTTVWFASSTGARRRHVQRTERLEATARSHGGRRSTWTGHASLQVPWTVLRDDLARALGWQATVVPWQPGRSTVLLPPSAVADLMVDLAWSSGARDASEGRTAFHSSAAGTRIGETVADPRVTLSSDPREATASCAPFALTSSSSRFGSVFDNGDELGATNWIRDGRLSNLIATSADARRLGIPHAPTIDTLRLDVAAPEHVAIDDLVADIDDGLLLTCVWYTRTVDPTTMLITGLTRDGVYVVKGGEVIGSAGNFRFNDSPLSILNRISSAGAPQRTLPREMADYANRTIMPPLVIEGFNLTSTSDAQ